MRLGAYPAILKERTIARSAYGKKQISERHRHRFEVNPKYIERLTRAGLVFSGVSPNHLLMEIIELPKKIHPFFLATQFHPEFKARPLDPHPLFTEFIKASIARNRKNTPTGKKSALRGAAQKPTRLARGASKSKQVRKNTTSPKAARAGGAKKRSGTKSKKK